MLLATTRQLCELQDILSAPGGIHDTARMMRSHPAGITAAHRAQHATDMRKALASRWLLQQFLPTEAANDLPSLPGAA